MMELETVKTWSLDILDVHVFITESEITHGLGYFGAVFEAVIEYGGETYTKDYIDSFNDAVEVLKCLFFLHTPHGTHYKSNIKFDYMKHDRS